ncbi:phosphodiesterase [Fervidicella metallireducens AeB]|uniref:Phosphoesterase n=1 Tax=Fervidicella metallireducens AeB TaxID=1403537 RepID=A0A017RSL7_9CLOT|nr:metallophosphoesterase [Fervidicella metallireducens]EYE87561.1 phosphodiesterase [Fervidicella metallireducens AeB]
MRIAIISDTHFHKNPDKIQSYIEKYFKDVDMIIHAGDYTNPKTVDILKSYKQFIGVWGNVDKDSTKEMLRETEILKINGYKIGIFHGHGKNKTTIERAYDKFKNEKVDIIVFGHSHSPTILTKGKVLMLNPGSLCYKRTERWHSFIIIELEKDGIKAYLKLF